MSWELPFPSDGGNRSVRLVGSNSWNQGLPVKIKMPGLYSFSTQNLVSFVKVFKTYQAKPVSLAAIIPTFLQTKEEEKDKTACLEVNTSFGCLPSTNKKHMVSSHPSTTCV